MAGLPPLIEEDAQTLDGALDELLRKTEATAAILIDKGGPIICQRGEVGQFDTTTIAALAAGSFSASQAIAERLGETNFSCIYQQGDHHSALFCNIEDDALLVVIFKSTVSAGVVKHYAAPAIERIISQLRAARQRAPGETIDMVSLNTVDPAAIFQRK